MAKVLIVEDDPLVSRMYQKSLSAEGFTVETADNGSQGVTKIREFQPDLVLLDIMMPIMNGIQVLEVVKNDPTLSHIPIVMLTSLSATQDVQMALSKGASAYLVKSEYTTKEVVMKVTEIISNSIN